MQRCHIPVLAIPEGSYYKTLNRVAFTTNHINLFTIEELQALRAILNLHKSKLYVLHVADEHHLAQKQLQNMDFFSAHFPEAIHDYIDVNKKDMFQTVHQYIVDNDIDYVSYDKRETFFFRQAVYKACFRNVCL